MVRLDSVDTISAICSLTHELTGIGFEISVYQAIVKGPTLESVSRPYWDSHSDATLPVLPFRGRQTGLVNIHNLCPYDGGLLGVFISCLRLTRRTVRRAMFYSVAWNHSLRSGIPRREIEKKRSVPMNTSFNAYSQPFFEYDLMMYIGRKCCCRSVIRSFTYPDCWEAKITFESRSYCIWPDRRIVARNLINVVLSIRSSSPYNLVHLVVPLQQHLGRSYDRPETKVRYIVPVDH